MAIDNSKREVERAILVGLATDSRHKHEHVESLEELRRLAHTAGAEVLSERVQVRPRPDPALFVGRGLVENLKAQLEELGGNSVIFDDPLSPAQQRNLEEALEAKVIDRPLLILDIFASGARSAAARMQVELAQLEYTLPRLTGAWLHFSRQYGGIGAKGPGETQLETDRRQVRDRIAHLKKKLKKLATQRATQRQARSELFKIALVGYTNAGKSTLFNVLTRAEIATADRLFTTLDSTTRAMSVGYPCRVVFSDTVGFIRKLPHQLVESFKSTLEEVALADLLLLVADCSDPKMQEHIEHTREVLAEIGAESVPYVIVYNKLDANPEFATPSDNSAVSFVVSALESRGLAALKAELVARAGRVRAT